MKTLSSLRLLSIIHAVKCNKATDQSMANDYFDRLKAFRNAVLCSSEAETVLINEQIKAWAATAPVVTGRDIDQLSKN